MLKLKWIPNNDDSVYLEGEFYKLKLKFSKWMFWKLTISNPFYNVVLFPMILIEAFSKEKIFWWKLF